MSLIEILISSAPKPSFLYFNMDDEGNIIENYDREETENYDIINKLHEGIIDFALEYRKRTREYKFLQLIPPRDASAPLMSLLAPKRYEVFAKDFKDFYYTYLVGGTNQVNLVSFYDVYKDELRKISEKYSRLFNGELSENDIPITISDIAPLEDKEIQINQDGSYTLAPGMEQNSQNSSVTIYAR